MFARRLKLIGARVRFYRSVRGMTQLQLAEASSLSEDYISKVETGKAPGIQIVSALAIAKALDVTLEKLTQEEI